MPFLNAENPITERKTSFLLYLATLEQAGYTKAEKSKEKYVRDRMCNNIYWSEQNMYWKVNYFLKLKLETKTFINRYSQKLIVIFIQSKYSGKPLLINEKLHATSKSIRSDT